ncbi:MAG TPA: regulatory protein RecX [Candidatus Scatomorpha merdipullorum]|uniref:Regulatory protein RecX n=1 Tax=Candidatus Scatomorpha merdipullorum TaxID=2840927 RepID=A0A9D1FEN6_9FIRM|nr:regulatory protein RecX [Candidatus Scatomorpha merdipullorum]
MTRPKEAAKPLGTPEAARKKALSLLERRDYGSAELAAKLVEKGASPSDAEAAVARMVEYGFVNDENYAAMVARHYAAKGYGQARIREELRRRRLDRELWDAALDAAPENSEAAYRLFAAKMRGGCDKDAVRKASAALVRRGFSWEDVRAAAERYLSEMENT